MLKKATDLPDNSSDPALGQGGDGRYGELLVIYDGQLQVFASVWWNLRRAGFPSHVNSGSYEDSK